MGWAHRAAESIDCNRTGYGVFSGGGEDVTQEDMNKDFFTNLALTELLSIFDGRGGAAGSHSFMKDTTFGESFRLYRKLAANVQ